MDDSVRQMLELSRLENGVQALRRTEFSLTELVQERLRQRCRRNPRGAPKSPLRAN